MAFLWWWERGGVEKIRKSWKPYMCVNNEQFWIFNIVLIMTTSQSIFSSEKWDNSTDMCHATDFIRMTMKMMAVFKEWPRVNATQTLCVWIFTHQSNKDRSGFAPQLLLWSHSWDSLESRVWERVSTILGGKSEGSEESSTRREGKNEAVLLAGSCWA